MVKKYHRNVRKIQYLLKLRQVKRANAIVYFDILINYKLKKKTNN